MTENNKVIIAMSGGVDSAVAAVLLQRQGYQVQGLTLRLWHYSSAEQDGIQAAKEVADKIGIQLTVLDAREDFRREIVQAFLTSHQNCLTPNPCVLCNKSLKWNKILAFADEQDAKFVATGHYARVQQSADGFFQLYRAKDLEKDQSYMLSQLGQNELSRTIFPLGDLTKEQVRQIAREIDLNVAERKDSQDLCFVNRQDYHTFLQENLSDLMRSGAIRTREGKLLGQHNGLAFYTIGQRKGLPAYTEALYVIEKDPRANTLIVGTTNELGKTSFHVADPNWISSAAPDFPLHCDVKIRYQAKLADAQLTQTNDGKLLVKLAEPLRDITPGQAAVFFQRDLVLGGGTIIESD